MTTIRFIGTGGAFEPVYGNSAALVQHRGQLLLLDCGFTVYPELARRGLTGAFDGILLTHLHNDHSGSLANLLLHRYHLKTGPPPVIWYAAGSFCEDIVRFLTIQLKEPSTFATFRPLAELAGVRALDTFGRHSSNYQSYGYAFEEADERLVYSGDLRDADYLFTWVDTLPRVRRTRILHDISFDAANTAHAYYQQLLPHQARYPELLGYHCDPTKSPADNIIPLVAHSPELLL